MSIQSISVYYEWKKLKAKDQLAFIYVDTVILIIEEDIHLS